MAWRWSLTLSFGAFLLGTPGWAQDAPQVITVTLSSYAFTPSAIALKAGVPVRLHLVNGSGKSHSFDLRLTPARAGTYPLKCTHFMHSGLGMTGTITVQ